MNTVRIAAIASSILLAAGATVAANAQGVTETVKVKLYPYELASAEGRTAALNSIAMAAERLCAPEKPLYSRSERNSCEKRTTEQLVRQTGNPALYAMWSHNGAVETASRD